MASRATPSTLSIGYGPRYRVLGCSDGSPASLEVFSALRLFMERAPVEIALLRVYVATVGDRGGQREMADCKRQIEELHRRLPANITSRTVVLSKPALRSVQSEIVKTATRLRSNAIAISTHGCSAQHHLLAGSTALAVLAESPSPVILARGSRAATVSQ